MFYQCILFLLICAIKLLKVQTSGKYEYVMENFEQCTDPEYMNQAVPWRNLKFQKINRTAKTLNFDISFIRPMDKNVGVTIKAEKITNSGSKKFVFLPLIHNACKFLLTSFREQWVIFTTTLGVKHPDVCPIPVGNYSMRNYVYNSKVKSPIIMPMSGRFIYEFILLSTDTNTVYNCIQMIFVSKDVL